MVRKLFLLALIMMIISGCSVDQPTAAPVAAAVETPRVEAPPAPPAPAQQAAAEKPPASLVPAPAPAPSTA